MDTPRKTSRRQFLKGHAAAEALADLVVGSEPPPDSFSTDSPAAGDDSTLMQISRRAMACEFAIYLNAGQNDNTVDGAVEALDMVEQLEDQMSVFQDHSELSRINRDAALEEVIVEPKLFSLLEQCVDLNLSTGGTFDITSGPLSKVWGFFRREGKIPSDEALQVALSCVGSQWLMLNQKSKTIRFLKKGVELNLGGIGKGFALDACVEKLQEKGCNHYLIHGGQSSVVARGCRTGRAVANNKSTKTGWGWKVGVRHPYRPEKRVVEILLLNQAMGTSGTAAQSFYHQGRRYGHILDPRNGRPAEGMLSSTVIAPTAAMADGLATAFYVMGADAAIDYCQAHDNLAAIFIRSAERSGAICVDSVGLRDEDWQLYE